MTEAVKVSRVDLAQLAWRKSSRSTQNGSNGACVEVAHLGLSVVLRDSKSPNRGTLNVSESGWTSFLRVSKM